jgi:hypothetical protein
MSRVQHSKPWRRWAWAAAAAVLLALPTAAPAPAQGLFFLFGSPPPDEIERRLAAAGYFVTGPLTLRGDVYVADVVVRGGGPERLVIDAQSGRIVERYRGRADRWREAAAPPPSAWGDDQSLWDGPRPPNAVGPGAAPPPDAFSPPRSSVLEAPKEAKPKIVETKPKPTPKPTPVANVNNPPPAAVVPPPPAPKTTASPTVSSSPAAAPASPSPAPSAAAAPTNPPPAAAPPSPPPSIEAAKADTPSLAKPAPAAAPAKSKAVNDIPVTPLD